MFKLCCRWFLKSDHGHWRWSLMRSLHGSGKSSVNEGPIQVSEEVQSALADGQPVVALESTIVTHGMPFPANLRTATQVEATVRDNGAVPATIALIDGQVKVGLKKHELEALATPRTVQNDNLIKISRRDLAFAVSNKLSGGTTVAATMAIAAQAGIRIFATGGCGGVHRGAETTLDISADLMELSRTNVCVVSAGIKSILDIGRTLEYLETLGVPVVTLDESIKSPSDLKNVQFPSFFTRSSGFKSPMAVSTISAAADILAAHQELELKNGLLFAVPIPTEESVSGEAVEKAIEQALVEVSKLNVSGKEVTPFVLRRVNELTGGQSLKANVTLIKNNARVAAQIAVELSTRSRGRSWSGTRTKRSLNSSTPPSSKPSEEASSSASATPKPVVIGGSIVDFVIRTESKELKATNVESLGGVGRNLADGLAKLGHEVLFVSAVGHDDQGRTVRASNPRIDRRGFLELPKVSTSAAFVILDGKGDCKLIACDLEAHKFITPSHVSKFEADIARAPMVVMDANIPLESMDKVASICQENNVPIWYEPTDLSIADKILHVKEQFKPALKLASPNLAELRTMARALSGLEDASQLNFNDTQLKSNRNESTEDILVECSALGARVLSHAFETLLITLGAHGLVIMTKRPNGEVASQHFKAPVIRDIVSVSGAGDCLTAATISGLLRGQPLSMAVELGLEAANLSLRSRQTVPDSLKKLSIASERDVNEL